MKRKISKNGLVNYIKEEQVAYKFGDGLVGFTNQESDNTNDIKEVIDDITSCIERNNDIRLVERNSVLDDKLGFSELACWSNDNDLHILVGEELLIVVGTDKKRDIIFESNNR